MCKVVVVDGCVCGWRTFVMAGVVKMMRDKMSLMWVGSLKGGLCRLQL